MNNKEADKTRCSGQLNRRSLIAATVGGGITAIAGCMGGSGDEPTGQPEETDQTGGSENGDSDGETVDTNDDQSSEGEYNVDAKDILVYAEDVGDDMQQGGTHEASSDNDVENSISDQQTYMLDLNGVTISNTAYVFADTETATQEFDKAPGLTVSETLLDASDSDVGDEAVIYRTEKYENGVHVEARLANVIIGVTYSNSNEGADLESEATSIAEQMFAKL